MRFRPIHLLGASVAVAAVALTGCRSPSNAEAASSTDAITSATTPVSDDPTAEDPREFGISRETLYQYLKTES